MPIDFSQLVEDLHRAEPPAKTVEGALAFTVRVARTINARSIWTVGLLEKTAGENIALFDGRSVSASRLISLIDGQMVKVLTDVPTTNGPSWQLEETDVDRGRIVVVPPFEDVPRWPAPDPPPADVDRIAQVLELLAKQEQTLARIGSALARLEERTATKQDLHDVREEFVVAVKKAVPLLSRFL